MAVAIGYRHIPSLQGITAPEFLTYIRQGTLHKMNHIFTSAEPFNRNQIDVLISPCNYALNLPELQAMGAEYTRTSQFDVIRPIRGDELHHPLGGPFVRVAGRYESADYRRGIVPVFEFGYNPDTMITIPMDQIWRLEQLVDGADFRAADDHLAGVAGISLKSDNLNGEPLLHISTTINIPGGQHLKITLTKGGLRGAIHGVAAEPMRTKLCIIHTGRANKYLRELGGTAFTEARNNCVHCPLAGDPARVPRRDSSLIGNFVQHTCHSEIFFIEQAVANAMSLRYGPMYAEFIGMKKEEFVRVVVDQTQRMLAEMCKNELRSAGCV